MKRMGYARVALAAAVGTGALITMPAHAGSTPTRTTTCDVPPGSGIDPDTVSLTGSPVLWPPNHKMVGYVLTAQETAEEQQNPPDVSLTYTITSDDASGGDGGPIHSPDADPATASGSGPFKVSLPFQLRAERSGLGSGRTYTIMWNAVFDSMKHPCSGSFTVTVPHDNGH